MITIADLNRIKGIVKVTTLAKEANVPIATINDKMKDNRELRIDESERISEALSKFGLYYKKETEPDQHGST